MPAQKSAWKWQLWACVKDYTGHSFVQTSCAEPPQRNDDYYYYYVHNFFFADQFF